MPLENALKRIHREVSSKSGNLKRSGNISLCWHGHLMPRVVDIELMICWWRIGRRDGSRPVSLAGAWLWCIFCTFKVNSWIRALIVFGCVLRWFISRINYVIEWHFFKVIWETVELIGLSLHFPQTAPTDKTQSLPNLWMSRGSSSRW